MKLANEDRDTEFEARAPLVHALLGLVEALDDLEDRVLLGVRHSCSHKSGRELFHPTRSAAGGTCGEDESTTGFGQHTNGCSWVQVKG